MVGFAVSVCAVCRFTHSTSARRYIACLRRTIFGLERLVDLLDARNNFGFLMFFGCIGDASAHELSLALEKALKVSIIASD